jgi:hypothetical protein
MRGTHFKSTIQNENLRGKNQLAKPRKKRKNGYKKSILFLEGFQAMPARPSDKDRVTVKTLG